VLIGIGLLIVIEAGPSDSEDDWSAPRSPKIDP
jgi:hypothetical protein